MERIVQGKRSIIVAADVPNIESLVSLAEAMVGVPGISSFKIGLSLGMKNLKTAVTMVKLKMGFNFPIIYDHQKGGNDIPPMGKQFAEVLEDSGVNAAILFPFAGPATQKAWTKACFDSGLRVLTGGIMTHSQFLVSEGGYIADEAVERIFRLACELGVKDFVVPGNKIEWVKLIRSWLIEELGDHNFVLYAPGFITQTGDISECGLVAGDEWHAIVGSAIYERPTKEDQRQAAITVTRQIMA
jgi:orotidine-5'-phosphate decarboxylase